jgi:hypothetical protein
MSDQWIVPLIAATASVALLFCGIGLYFVTQALYKRRAARTTTTRYTSRILLPTANTEPAVYDIHGTQQDMDWVRTTYGNVEIVKPSAEDLEGASHVFRIVKLQEAQNNLELCCSVGGVDQDDKVAFYWPGAPSLPPYDPPTARWEDRAFVANILLGTAKLCMGGDSDYNPETQTGAYRIWVLKPNHGSEFIKGLGWLMASAYRHLNVTFARFELDGNGNGDDPAGSWTVKGSLTVDLTVARVPEDG